MKSILLSIAMITVIIMGAAVMTARAQSGFETEPVLKAKDLVAPELLKGPHFTVDDRVPVKGFLAHFTIRSDYGTFEAHGIHMFQIRVKEVYALAQLEDMSNQGVRRGSGPGDRAPGHVNRPHAGQSRGHYRGLSR